MYPAIAYFMVNSGTFMKGFRKPTQATSLPVKTVTVKREILTKNLQNNSQEYYHVIKISVTLLILMYYMKSIA
jgi:hypothetical protein